MKKRIKVLAIVCAISILGTVGGAQAASKPDCEFIKAAMELAKEAVLENAKNACSQISAEVGNTIPLP